MSEVGKKKPGRQLGQIMVNLLLLKLLRQLEKRVRRRRGHVYIFLKLLVELFLLVEELILVLAFFLKLYHSLLHLD